MLQRYWLKNFKQLVKDTESELVKENTGVLLKIFILNNNQLTITNNTNILLKLVLVIFRISFISN